MPARRSRQARVAATLLVAALGLSACASTVDGKGGLGRTPDANLAVVGDSHGQFDTIVKNAISDVEAFWQQQYPKVSGGKPLPPLKGGLYSVDGLQVIESGAVPGGAANEGCAKQDANFIVDNGAYCRIDDSIIWDRNPNHLFGQLEQHYGPLVVALIFAHEFGHAISERLGVFNENLPTIDTESQADCAAGAFAASVLKNQAPHFRGMQGSLDEALEGFLDGRDSTPDNADQISHGDGFDRLSAIADGISKGVTFCYSPHYFDRKFTERPFTTDADLEQKGNESLAKVLDPTPAQQDGSGGGGLQPDLNRFWKAAAQSIHKSWTDVKIAEAPHPKCGASATSEFGYCPSDNTVYYSNSFAQVAYNSLPDISVDQTTGNVKLLFNQPADFALGTLFAIGWGLAVRQQLFGRSTTDKAALLAASCYTGAYAKDINRANFDSTHQFILSPPDLDEASSAMLTLVGQDRAFGARGTSGLDRIQAFNKGYFGGLSVC